MVEELRPEDLEELVQEFEEEDGVQESLPQEVEELLRVLQSGSLYLARQNAADQLGRVGTSSSRIIRVLAAAQASDAYPEVRRAAAKALRAPVHQQYVQQHPELQETAQRAIEKFPSSDSLDEDTRARLMRPASDTTERSLWAAVQPFYGSWPGCSFWGLAYSLGGRVPAGYSCWWALLS
jgi:hypothetical protein